MFASARAHVHHIIGAANGVLVVFNHQHRVAQVLQAQQGLYQAVVVALVQTNRGFIQYIHHTCQARTNLAGQSNALALAAAERIRTAVQS